MARADSDADVLRREFEAADGTFLYALQEEDRWDRDAFTRLHDALVVCCVGHGSATTLERWITSGFWSTLRSIERYLSWQEGLPEEDEEYYHEAHLRVEQATEWLLIGCIERQV